MGEDLSTGAKIGIILIILCSLIAIVFALLTMMKNITNSGSASLQNSLDQMMLTTFDDYNQKTVTGTQVISALRVFEGQDVAIVVKTGLCNSRSVLGGYNYGALLQGYASAEMPDHGTVYKCDGNQVNTAPAAVGDDGVVDVFNESSGDADLVDGIKLHTTQSYYLGALKKNGTAVQFNLNSKPISASSNATFVRSSAKFRAMLIKDTSGTNIGILFNEIVDTKPST